MNQTWLEGAFSLKGLTFYRDGAIWHSCSMLKNCDPVRENRNNAAIVTGLLAPPAHRLTPYLWDTHISLLVLNCILPAVVSLKKYLLPKAILISRSGWGLCCPLRLLIVPCFSFLFCFHVPFSLQFPNGCTIQLILYSRLVHSQNSVVRTLGLRIQIDDYSDIFYISRIIIVNAYGTTWTILEHYIEYLHKLAR